ncbi:MAG: hypothetical protein WD407_11745 [Rhodospirillales bacterium]
MKIVGVSLLALAAVALAAAGWLGFRDPLAALPAPPSPAQAQAQILSEAATIDRIERTVELPGDGTGLFISLPAHRTSGRLPVVILLGGLGSGAKNARYVPNPGNNALIAYDWPMPLRIPTGLAILPEIPDLHARLMSIPAQVTAAIAWAKRQPWADGTRISLLGFSLGALVAPAIQRMAEKHGHAVYRTVLAYGGVGIGDLIAHHPRIRNVSGGALLGHMADLLLRPLEPAHHLPHLHGRFLVITGYDDIFIPRHASVRLHALVPEPKTVIAKEGGHIGVGPNQIERLEEIVALSRAWLHKEGAITR